MASIPDLQVLENSSKVITGTSLASSSTSTFWKAGSRFREQGRKNWKSDVFWWFFVIFGFLRGFARKKLNFGGLLHPLKFKFFD